MSKKIQKQLFLLVFTLLLATVLPIKAFAAESDLENIHLNVLNTSENTAFDVKNMFPGDQETKDFRIKVSHKKPITLYYHGDIRTGGEKLAEVLMVKIELPAKNETLYDGLMRDMPEQLEHLLTAEETEVTYRITAYLDKSVGNDYQYESLIADFRWWYAIEDQGSSGTDTPAAPDNPETSVPSDPLDGEVSSQSPKTGDDNNIVLYSCACLAALFFRMVLTAKRKEGEAHE